LRKGSEISTLPFFGISLLVNEKLIFFILQRNKKHKSSQ
jgi:hypothetical protein